MKLPDKISSITGLHNLFNLKKPLHPLISVFDFNDIAPETGIDINALTTDFYVIALKKDCSGKCKYGQQYYDFDEGVMYFIAPQQVLQFENSTLSEVTGFVLIVHPDFFQNYPLVNKIKDYGFFSYASNEALHLSEKEETLIMSMIDNIKTEIEANIDGFTQDLLVSNIDLLLTYCDRFYNRQFLTRKKVNSDILTRLEKLLDTYFKDDKLLLNGIPTVTFIANELNLSPNYLSDMLRVHTGQTTKQHIQEKVIDKAKVLLSTTNLSVSEIAYQLGFEHSQSFNRLFKSRTTVSPLQFRQSYN